MQTVPYSPEPLTCYVPACARPLEPSMDGKQAHLKSPFPARKFIASATLSLSLSLSTRRPRPILLGCRRRIPSNPVLALFPSSDLVTPSSSPFHAPCSYVPRRNDHEKRSVWDEERQSLRLEKVTPRTRKAANSACKAFLMAETSSRFVLPFVKNIDCPVLTLLSR